MTPIGLILNLLLGGLLAAALALGLRLDRRLRALRDSQASFIKAVAELDQAAARTHAGLAQWREATDEARELLHDRIEKAKVQAARLEVLTTQAEQGAARTVEAPRPERRIDADRADLPRSERLAEPSRSIPEAPAFIREALREAARAASEAAVLTLAPRDVAPPAAPEPVVPFRAKPSPARSRAMVDDDLFEMAPAGAARLQRDLASAVSRRL